MKKREKWLIALIVLTMFMTGMLWGLEDVFFVSEGSESVVSLNVGPESGTGFLLMQTPGTVLMTKNICLDDPEYGQVIQLELLRPKEAWGIKSFAKSILNNSRVAFAIMLRMERFLPINMNTIHTNPDKNCFDNGELIVRINGNHIGENVVFSKPVFINVPENVHDGVVENTAIIEGYSDKISVYPNEDITFHVHSLEKDYLVEIKRHGVVNEVKKSISISDGTPQNYRLNAFSKGADWNPSFGFQIPIDWESGMYSARLITHTDPKAEFFSTFVVKGSGNTEMEPTEIAILASTNTWQAYNPWGGASLYVYDIDDGLPLNYSSKVNIHRPNPAASPKNEVGHLAGAELHVLRWLEQNEHRFHLFADWDLHQNPEKLKAYPVWIISTHSEYWSERMYLALESHLDNGGHLLYLSGNGLYWKAVIRENVIEVRKDHSIHVLDGTEGGLWSFLGKPASKVLGVSYPMPDLDFDTYAPFKVINADHWLFNGTGLKNGDLIGAYGLNRAASGLEMDKMDRYSPETAIKLAHGMNKYGGADMVYYKHPSGGNVFSASSITFGGSLPVDENLEIIVNNMLCASGVSTGCLH